MKVKPKIKSQKYKELKEKQKLFNKSLDKERYKYVRMINRNQESVYEYINEYNDFLQEQYTKNASRLSFYLDRYYYLDYKEGYMKNISLGIMSSLVVMFYIFYQDGVTLFFNTIWKTNLNIGEGLLLIGFVFLARIVMMIILIVIFMAGLYMLIKYIDSQLYKLFNKDTNTLLINIERNCVMKLLNEEFKLNV